MAPPPSDPTEASHRPGPDTQAGHKIIVALSGGIACHKSATLVSRLSQDGATVRVLMTEAAARFIAPLTLQCLSGLPVLSSIWQSDRHPESQHIGVARWCDLMIIAPASADIIARIAHGLTGDIVSLVTCSLPRGPRPTPVLLAPSMNAQMWDSPLTQRNLAILRDVMGFSVVGPEEGWQACRTTGPGRMSEPEAIRAAALDLLNI